MHVILACTVWYGMVWHYKRCIYRIKHKDIEAIHHRSASNNTSIGYRTLATYLVFVLPVCGCHDDVVV